MRRALIATVAALLIVTAALVVTFVFSEFHTKSRRPPHEAFADFVFVLDTGVRQLFGAPFPHLGEPAYQSVMGHARSGAHHFVGQAIEVRLRRWGQPALPLLERELEGYSTAAAAHDYSRIYQAIAGIGEIGGPRAAEILVDWLSADGHLERIADPDTGGGAFLRIVSTLGQLRDPRATHLLIQCYRRGYGPRGGGPVLDALGRSRTPNAVSFLLEEYAKAGTEAEFDELIWPLAFTHDPRAGAILAELRLHASERVRYRASNAASQERGSYLLEPYLALLERNAGDAIHSEVLRLIAHPANRGNPHALAAAAKRLGHPYLDGDARHALLALLDEASLPAYREALSSLQPSDMGYALRQLGAAALPLAQSAIESPAKPGQRAAVVRQIAIQKVFEGRELLTRLRADPDPRIREAARWALARLDKMALLRGFLDLLPADVAVVAWREVAGGDDPDDPLSDVSYGSGFGAVWQVFIVVHAAGAVVAALLGLLLVFNAIRVFQPYRFNLFIQFLLAEGFLGDFFFMDFGRGPDLVYLAATMAHLLLTIGFLCKERERLPGDERNRFERLGGASLWLLVPLLLFFGAPPLAQALHRGLADFRYFAALAALTGVLGLLVLEQTVLPISSLFRSARVERVMSFVFSGAVCALVGGALLRSASLQDASGEHDAGTFAWLLLAPLLWMLMLHAASLGLHLGDRPPRRCADAPTRRMKVIQEGETVTVWFAPRATVLATATSLAFKWGFVLAAAGLAGYYAGRSGQLPAIIVALIAALAGAVLAGLMVQAVGTRILMEMRDGYARCADTALGGVLGRAPWSRRVVFRAGVRRWLARNRTDGRGDAPLEPAELAWLEDVMAAGSGAVMHSVTTGQKIAIEAAATGEAASPTGGIPVTIRVANRGAYPVSITSLERGRTSARWQAWLGEHSCDLFFGRAARERMIPPGGSTELPARVFPPLLPSRPSELQLRVECGREQSNLFTVRLGRQA